MPCYICTRSPRTRRERAVVSVVKIDFEPNHRERVERLLSINSAGRGNRRPDVLLSPNNDESAVQDESAQDLGVRG